MKECKNFKGRFVRGFKCKTILSIADVVVPPQEGIPVEINKEDLLKEVDTFLLLVGKLKRFFIILLLFFVNYILPLFFLKLKQFSSLSFESRYRIMKKIHDSKIFSIRGIYILLSMLVMPYYYSRPEVLSYINYPYDRFYHNKREVA